MFGICDGCASPVLDSVDTTAQQYALIRHCSGAALTLSGCHTVTVETLSGTRRLPVRQSAQHLYHSHKASPDTIHGRRHNLVPSRHTYWVPADNAAEMLLTSSVARSPPRRARAADISAAGT